MKICVHISFYFNDERIKYLNKTINEINNYPHDTDIFIHTNKEIIAEEIFNKNKKGKLNIIVHTKFKNNNAQYLTWKCRSLLEKQIEDYDIFIYLEDDILLYKETLDYWLKYKDLFIKHKCNVGFMRVERGSDGELYWVDGCIKMNNFAKIGNKLYLVNDVQPYCAFWIYDKNEMKLWMNEEYWDPAKTCCHSAIHILEKSSSGKIWDQGYPTIIPITQAATPHPNCIVYHQGEKFVKFVETANRMTSWFSTIKFKEAINKKILQDATKTMF